MKEFMYLTQASDLAATAALAPTPIPILVVATANVTTIIALRIPHWILVSLIVLSFREV